jgi:hypothetical protein
VGWLLRLHRRSRAHRRQSPATLRKRPCKCASLTPTAGSRRSLDERVRNCNCVTHTHGGLTPAALDSVSHSRCTVRDSCGTEFDSPYHGGLTPVAGRKRPKLQLRYQTHGGLTPAALGSVSHSRCTVRGFRGTALGSPYHGGLTPAALVNLRSRIAKIVFSPGNVRTRTQERGA